MPSCIEKSAENGGDGKSPAYGVSPVMPRPSLAKRFHRCSASPRAMKMRCDADSAFSRYVAEVCEIPCRRASVPYAMNNCAAFAKWKAFYSTRLFNPCVLWPTNIDE